MTVPRRTRVRRKPDRGVYDLVTIQGIIDQTLYCHVSCLIDGSVATIPTLHVRVDNEVHLHGSVKNRIFNALLEGADACVAFTRVDALVLARSAFHQSLNYRSVIAYGRFRPVEDSEERFRSFAALTEHVLPGRWAETRPPEPQEDAATLVLAMKLDEASAKVRAGPPVDAQSDLGGPSWAGLVPISLRLGTAEPDPQLRPGIQIPVSVRESRPVWT